MDMIALAWRRIDTWFETFAPADAKAFLPGAVPSEIEAAETRLGLTLPEDVKASYRIHNGASSEGLLMGRERFCTLEQMVGWWEMMRDVSRQDPAWAQRPPIWVRESINPSQPVQPTSWHLAWLPFTSNIARDHWCFDLAPLSGGHIGQILEWDHDMGPFHVLFTSFEELLSTYADQLEAGLYVQHGPPLNQLRELTHLKERHVAFQQSTPAKPLLQQAISLAWNFRFEDDASITSYDMIFEGDPSAYGKAFDACTTIYQKVLQMHEATLDDRFFAYYGLISLYMQQKGMLDNPDLSLFEEWEAEASNMPPAHWVHEEVAFWKEWLIE